MGSIAVLAAGEDTFDVNDKSQFHGAYATRAGEAVSLFSRPECLYRFVEHHGEKRTSAKGHGVIGHMPKGMPVCFTFESVPKTRAPPCKGCGGIVDEQKGSCNFRPHGPIMDATYWYDPDDLRAALFRPEYELAKAKTELARDANGSGGLRMFREYQLKSAKTRLEIARRNLLDKFCGHLLKNFWPYASIALEKAIVNQELETGIYAPL